jgi:hypothetical protein
MYIRAVLEGRHNLILGIRIEICSVVLDMKHFEWIFVHLLQRMHENCNCYMKLKKEYLDIFRHLKRNWNWTTTTACITTVSNNKPVVVSYCYQTKLNI